MAYKIELNWTLDLGVAGERDCCVIVNYAPGRPGIRTLPNGDPGYPDDPDEFEIIKADCEGLDITHMVDDYLMDSDSFAEAVSEAYYG